MNSSYISLLLLFSIFGLSLARNRTEKHKYESINRELDRKIAGGYPAQPGQYPFFVGIKIILDGSKKYQCSGALIAEDLVLTAAHCVDEKTIKRIEVATTHIAQRNWDKEGVKTYTNRKICISPEYERSKIAITFDYAIIRLNERVEFSDSVNPISLPDAQLDRKSEAFALGTGLVSNLGGQNVLPDSLNVLPVRRDICLGLFDYSDKSRICFESSRKEFTGDTCKGDSGGPIVAEANGRMRVYAITSSGYSTDCIKGKRGTTVGSDVYGQIDHILNMIRDCV